MIASLAVQNMHHITGYAVLTHDEDPGQRRARRLMDGLSATFEDSRSQAHRLWNHQIYDPLTWQHEKARARLPVLSRYFRPTLQ